MPRRASRVSARISAPLTWRLTSMPPQTNRVSMAGVSSRLAVGVMGRPLLPVAGAPSGVSTDQRYSGRRLT